MFSVYIYYNIRNSQIHTQINGMTSGNVHVLLGHQTSLAHNALGQPPAMYDHTVSGYPLSLSLMLHPHLQIKKSIGNKFLNNINKNIHNMINLILYSETISCSTCDFTIQPKKQTACSLYLQNKALKTVTQRKTHYSDHANAR